MADPKTKSDDDQPDEQPGDPGQPAPILSDPDDNVGSDPVPREQPAPGGIPGNQAPPVPEDPDARVPLQTPPQLPEE